MTLRPVDASYLAERRALENEEQRSALKGDDGGGKSPPMQKDDGLKGRVDTLQVFMVVFLAGLLAMAAAVLVSAGSTNTRLDTIQTTGSVLNREVGEVGKTVDGTNQRLDRIEAQLQEINRKLK